MFYESFNNIHEQFTNDLRTNTNAIKDVAKQTNALRRSIGPYIGAYRNNEHILDNYWRIQQ